MKERSKTYKEENSEQIKAYRNEYSKIEIDCEVCKCKVKTCRWKKHIETQKHKNNDMIKRKARAIAPVCDKKNTLAEYPRNGRQFVA